MYNPHPAFLLVLLVFLSSSALSQNKCSLLLNAETSNHIKSWSMTVDVQDSSMLFHNDYSVSSAISLNLSPNTSLKNSRSYFSDDALMDKNVSYYQHLLTNSIVFPDSLNITSCNTPYNIILDTSFCALASGTPLSWGSAIATKATESKKNQSLKTSQVQSKQAHVLNVPTDAFYIAENLDLASSYNYGAGILTVNQYAYRPCTRIYHKDEVENKMAELESYLTFYAHRSEPYRIDFGYFDEDGDSVSVDLIPVPAIKLNSSMSYLPADIHFDSVASFPFSTGFSSLNPFPTSSFSLDKARNQINFVPTDTGFYNFAVRLSEYRYGQLIAYSDKVIGVQVLDDVKKQPYISGPKNVLSPAINNGSNAIYSCSGDNISFDVELKDYNPSTSGLVYEVSYHGFSPINLPSYTVAYTNNTDSAVLHFTYSGSPQDYNWKYINIMLRDTNCLPEDGYESRVYQTIPLYAYNSLTSGQISNSTICGGDTVSINFGTSAYVIVPIQGDLGSLSCTACQNPVAFLAITTTYICYPLVPNLSCSQTNIDTFTIEVFPDFKLSIGGQDSIICITTLTDQLTATTIPVVKGLKYKWGPTGLCSPPDQARTTVTVNNGIQKFWVEAWDSLGCHIDRDTVLVYSVPNFNPSSSISKNIMCEGDSLSCHASGADSYKWTLRNGNLDCDTCASTAAYPLLGQNTLDIVMYSDVGCKEEDSYQIQVLASPVADAGDDYTIYDGAIFELDGSKSYGLTSSFWRPSNYLKNPTSLQTEGQFVPETGDFILTVSNGYCEDMDTAKVIVLPCLKYPIPNVFEPTSGLDAIYHFRPNMRDPNTHIHMRIYNRWGNLLYEEDGKAANFQGWDGKYNGEMQVIENYVYVIDVQCVTPAGEPKEVRLEGNFILLY